MMSLWDALRMNMMISYQELVRTFPNEGGESFSRRIEKLPSRDLPTALREYAPGADVVLGGKVY
ncbi:hypothetical protein OFN47_23630, partial [Escherichia coli]|nr:hypothetical protein [Escherichia coli]